MMPEKSVMTFSIKSWKEYICIYVCACLFVGKNICYFNANYQINIRTDVSKELKIIFYLFYLVHLI